MTACSTFMTISVAAGTGAVCTENDAVSFLIRGENTFNFTEG